ncbi:Yop protein translocation protein H [compost metagenome]
MRVEPIERGRAVDDQSQVAPAPDSTRVGKAPAHELAQLLLERFGTPDKGPKQDRLALQAYLHEHIPLGKHQETALLMVLGELKGGGKQTDYLVDLIHDDLKWLIPRNGMLTNLLRNSYKPELE